MVTRVGDIRARFEQKIAQNEEALSSESGGMYLVARLAKQKNKAENATSTSSTSMEQRSPKKPQHRPPQSPTKCCRFRTDNDSKGILNSPKGRSAGSVSSRTVSTESVQSDGSSGELKPPTVVRQISPKRNPVKDRVSAKRTSFSQKRFVDIPQSIDEDKEIVGCTIVMCGTEDLNGSLVLQLDDEAGMMLTSPRRGSIVGHNNALTMEECEQSHSSRGSTLSRSSPQIRRLPRDMDFDSDDSSMSDDDGVGLAKHRQKAKKPLPKPRYW